MPLLESIHYAFVINNHNDSLTFIFQSEKDHCEIKWKKGEILNLNQ